MADTCDSKSHIARCEGSSPSSGTLSVSAIICYHLRSKRGVFMSTLYEVQLSTGNASTDGACDLSSLTHTLVGMATIAVAIGLAGLLLQAMFG
jgi:hypothetical protein